MTWANTTLAEFESAVKSSDPTPGGATVAAVALGQAAALLSMVADLTLSSDRWSDAHQAAHDAKAAAAAVLPRASHLADADAHAFDAVVEAFKLPKSTEEEKRPGGTKSVPQRSELPRCRSKPQSKHVDCCPTCSRWLNVETATLRAMLGWLLSGHRPQGPCSTFSSTSMPYLKAWVLRCVLRFQRWKKTFETLDEHAWTRSARACNHRTRDPLLITSLTVRRRTHPSSSSAANIIPSLITPRSFRGARLATTTTWRPNKSSAE